MAKRQFTLTAEEIEEFKQAERETQDVRELKRLQAVRLYGQGVATREIIQMIQCSDRRIRDWSHKYHDQGLNGLKSHWQGNNALKLSRKQRANLKNRLHQYNPQDVMASDSRVSQGQFWTVTDLQIMIKTWYNVSYKAIGSYRQLLHECGFSYQRTESVYRSQPNPQTLANFEAHLEKK